jgi:hypothetical protein
MIDCACSFAKLPNPSAPRSVRRLPWFRRCPPPRKMPRALSKVTLLDRFCAGGGPHAATGSQGLTLTTEARNAVELVAARGKAEPQPKRACRSACGPETEQINAERA